MRGKIYNALNVNELGFDAEISNLEAKGESLQQLIPDTLLPQGIKFPELITLSSDLKGKINDTLQLSANLKTFRNNQIATVLNTRGQVGNLLGEDLFYNLSILKFNTTNQDLYDLLPDGVLPSGYALPESVNAVGQLSGTLNSVNPNLKIKADTGDGFAEFKATGKIDDFSKPTLDFSLSDTKIDTAFLNKILPDSLLPSTVRLPNIRVG